MPTRSAHTAWQGGLQDGSGTVELATSKAATLDVSFPKRASEDGGGITNPEELIGAAHSSCYAMALSNELGQAGGTINSLDVTADVTLGPDPDGGFKVTGIALRVSADVDGVDADGFAQAADAAKSGCPISKALAAVDITLDANLGTSA